MIGRGGLCPEVLRNDPTDERSDVYSFAVILWELITLKYPWEELSSPVQIVVQVAFLHRRPKLPTWLPTEVRVRFVFSSRTPHRFSRLNNTSDYSYFILFYINVSSRTTNQRLNRVFNHHATRGVCIPQSKPVLKSSEHTK